HGIKITSEALFTDGKMTLHLESLCEVSNFNGNAIGFHPVTLAFEFKSDLKSSTSFHIVRFIEAHCMTTMGKELAPVVTYRPQGIHLPNKYVITDCHDSHCHFSPLSMSVMKLKHKVQLKPYPIPDFMNALIIALKQQTYYSDRRKDILEAALSWENYAEKFKLMLFLEELQMEVDIQRYNIPNDNQPEVLSVGFTVSDCQVPGVAENRPSVLRGDQLLAYPIGESNKKYRGYVHCVQLDSVKLGFSSELLDIFIEGMKFNIEFIINRLTLRIQHRAAEFAERSALAPVLFPVAPPSPASQQTLPDLKKLEKNPEQYRAVQHIVAGSSKPAPYLVFGPPGTGKTVTVVEAIKQIEKCKANCHILACAPSNSAADLLCKKIRDHVDVSSVFRMYASSHDPMLVPEEIKACSNLIGNCYEYPEKEKLMEYKIVVTTLITAGRLVSGDIPMGHFTHVFVDESGHAVETECIVPLAGLLHPETGQVVLAGDPKQLGPIIRSPLALKLTSLSENQWSHPAILEIPNELFYDRELQACADEQRNFYCNWEYLPKMNFPVIFHGVTGLDTRESSSPSFFNIAEVEVLMDYVMKLLQTQGKKGLSTLSPKDIGIIAPYRKQVQKIRKALHIVGSVEEFQGQERRVILVSTVRSSPDYVEIDKKFKLGFVKNEKRFNVAITRAKALLIIVGNPLVLRSDPTWARFLQYCQDQGGYRGYVQTEEDQDIVERCASLYLSMEVEGIN
uniref:RNA helicase n=1 Tax=Periophthalmus magnuspinnatus TaxID=409849 RepID=A0A3B3ZVS3_9GOBI